MFKIHSLTWQCSANNCLFFQDHLTSTASINWFPLATMCLPFSPSARVLITWYQQTQCSSFFACKRIHPAIAYHLLLFLSKNTPGQVLSQGAESCSYLIGDTSYIIRRKRGGTSSLSLNFEPCSWLAALILRQFDPRKIRCCRKIIRSTVYVATVFLKKIGLDS